MYQTSWQVSTQPREKEDAKRLSNARDQGKHGEQLGLTNGSAEVVNRKATHQLGANVEGEDTTNQRS